ncbi:MAG: hypothetical protein Q8O89_02475 [Nanoarchaeota archaeon]|nr:hypothetical protein [Nanoarchaeota archaeon]
MSKMRLMVKLTDEQYKLIKLRTQILGFKTISAFVAEKIFKNNSETESKLAEIHKKIVRKKWEENSSIGKESS